MESEEADVGGFGALHDDLVEGALRGVGENEQASDGRIRIDEEGGKKREFGFGEIVGSEGF